MNKSKIITLRVPFELKVRLENEAKLQGVSLNNLANYFLATQLSQAETLSYIESRISQKSLEELKSKVSEMINTAPKKKHVPVWDRVE